MLRLCDLHRVARPTTLVMSFICADRNVSGTRITLTIWIVCALLAPAAASFGQSFLKIEGTSARDRSQRSSSLFSILQTSAQLGLSDVSVLRMLACKPSTQSPLTALDSLVSFEGVAIANVTHFSGYQTVEIDVWGGRNAADSYMVCAVKASLPYSSNKSSTYMQLQAVSSGAGHSASSINVQDATAYVSSFRSWLGNDPYYAGSYNYKRYDEFASIFSKTFALNLPDSPCALVSFGASGVSSTSRYRMIFKLPFGSPEMTAFDFWVAPTLFTTFQSTTAHSSSISALVVRGNKFGVRTRSAEDAFPSQPNIGCCPVATVPSPLYPGRCVLCSQHIVSSASIASWQPLNSSFLASDAACSMPFTPSADTCNQTSQTCSCRCVGFKVLIQRFLFPFFASYGLIFHTYHFRAVQGED
jgi:hypothetical protein